MSNYNNIKLENNILCEPLVAYSSSCHQLSILSSLTVSTHPDDIKVIELFAGVGGFRIGLERASDKFKTIWNNQWGIQQSDKMLQ